MLLPPYVQSLLWIRRHFPPLLGRVSLFLEDLKSTFTLSLSKVQIFCSHHESPFYQTVMVVVEVNEASIGITSYFFAIHKATVGNLYRISFLEP